MLGGKVYSPIDVQLVVMLGGDRVYSPSCYLIKQLFARRAGLYCKLQLSIHRRHTHVHLQSISNGNVNLFSEIQDFILMCYGIEEPRVSAHVIILSEIQN